MKIDIRQCDDWIALYIDQHKEYEGHSISPTMLLDYLKIPYSQQYFEHGEYDEVTITRPDGSDLFPETLDG